MQPIGGLNPDIDNPVDIDSGDQLPPTGLAGVTEIMVTFTTAVDDTVEISEIFLKACNPPSKIL